MDNLQIQCCFVLGTLGVALKLGSYECWRIIIYIQIFLNSSIDVHWLWILTIGKMLWRTWACGDLLYMLTPCSVYMYSDAGLLDSMVVARVRHQPSHMLSSLVAPALFNFWRNLYTILIWFYSIVCKNRFFFTPLPCTVCLFVFNKKAI